LPKELDGLRIAQLTDIHLSPFLSERDLARAVDMANETRPHLALVTGDLITSAQDPLDDCLHSWPACAPIAASLAAWVTMKSTRTPRTTSKQGARLGIVSCGPAERLHFGGATLNLAGVDYQPSRKPYLVGANRLIDPGAST
jgi:hypothetical protein